MSTDKKQETAVEVLKQLGLKEYEAKCFAGLARLSKATAKQLSDATGVPRTRIYDAINVLEAQGLVETQHSTPQQFRAVPLNEAIETLRDQYEDRVDRLASALEGAKRDPPVTNGQSQEVWAMSGVVAIENRANQVISDATDEIVLVIGDDSLLTHDLVAVLNDVDDTVDLYVGAVTEPLQTHIQDSVPDADTYVSGLEWLHSDDATDTLAIGRLLLVDRSTILVSSILTDSGEEHAVFGSGFGNGLVLLSRRLMAQGLSGSIDRGI